MNKEVGNFQRFTTVEYKTIMFVDFKQKKGAMVGVGARNFGVPPVY